MAVTFTFNTSDAIDGGSGTSLDDAITSTWTFICWGSWPSVANPPAGQGCIVSKVGGTDVFAMFRRGADGTSIRTNVEHDAVSTANNSTTAMLAANTPTCIAVTVDLSGVTVAHYKGTKTAIMTAWGSTTSGTPQVHDSDAGVFRLGESNTATITSDGMTISYAALFNRVLTLNEMIGWQFRPRAISGCVLFYAPWSATTVVDLSGNGNTGTGTGLVVADHIGLGPPFGVSEMRPYIVSSAASAVPRFWAQYRPRMTG